MEPESWFMHRCRRVREVRLPKDGGIVPLRLLLWKVRLTNPFNFPISLGMEPESLLLNRSNTIKRFKFPKVDGMGPVSLLFSMQTIPRLVVVSISSGMELESWLIYVDRNQVAQIAQRRRNRTTKAIGVHSKLRKRLHLAHLSRDWAVELIFFEMECFEIC